MVVCNPLLQADCEGPYPHLLRRLLRHTDVGFPDPIRGIYLKFAIQKVRSDREIVLAVRGYLEPSPGFNAQLQPAHYAARLVTSNIESFFSQSFGHPSGSIGLL